MSAPWNYIPADDVPPPPAQPTSSQTQPQTDQGHGWSAWSS